MLSKRLDVVPPATRDAARLTFVLWLAVYIVLGPVTWLAGQVVGLAELLSIPSAFATSFLFAFLLYFGIRRVAGQQLWIAVPALASALTLTAILQLAGDYGGQYLLHASFLQHRMPDTSPQALLMIGGMYWILDACNLALLWVASAARKIRLDQVELAETRAAQLEAQLNMLRMQLNPHFMSNSLNAISGLIADLRAEEARRMTDKLAEFLRCSSSIEGVETSLGDELDLIDAYLEVEAGRFGDRLTIDIVRDEDIEHARVPNFILQPVVENALKYGVHHSRGPAALRIFCSCANGVLTLSVENEAAEARPDNPEMMGDGVGLANIRARLALLFGDDACLETVSLPTGCRTTITLPSRPREAIYA